jgi:hypothetical protein
VKYPKKSQLIEALMGLLYIEREAAYRRLRKDVTFSTYEIAKICSAWNISMDNILNINSEKISFLMHPVNYITPSEQDIQFLRHTIKSINELNGFSNTESMDICNKLPRQLLAGFKHLDQFYLFKCIYQYGNEKNIVPFSQITVSDETRQLTEEYYRAIKNVPNANYIFDHMLFDNLVAEIKHFNSIHLITDKEKELIKKDLFALLDYLLAAASNGYYPESQNTVNLYISQLYIDTNYSYIYANQIIMCYIHVFEKYEIYTCYPEMATKFRLWMQLKKRSATLISGVDEKSKIEFFVKQRKIVEML